MDYEKSKKAFQEYLKLYKKEDSKIQLKIAHTYGVVAACEYIVGDLDLSQEDRELARLIGLLHDIGRFRQLMLCGSFDDSILSHVECGLDILFNEGMIEVFISERTYDTIIYTAIKNHGAFRLPEGLTGKELLHSQIIRDADKMDNFRVKYVSSMITLVDVTPEELAKEFISENVFQDLLNHRSILNSNCKTHMDMWISYLGYIFDFNFTSGFQFVKDNDYITKIISRISYTNPDTKLKMDFLQRMVLEYIDNPIISKPN